MLTQTKMQSQASLEKKKSTSFEGFFHCNKSFVVVTSKCNHYSSVIMFNFKKVCEIDYHENARCR